MDDKDTFYTESYRGGFVSQCYNRTRGHWEYQARYDGETYNASTWQAAKIWIGRRANAKEKT